MTANATFKSGSLLAIRLFLCYYSYYIVGLEFNIILAYSCSILGVIILYFGNLQLIFIINIITSLLSIFLGYNAFKHLRQIQKPVTKLTNPLSRIQELSAQSLSCEHNWIFIRFTLFLTFMASINSFFLSVTPFFLINFLHYQPVDLL